MKRLIYAVMGSALIGITVSAEQTAEGNGGLKEGWQVGPNVGYTCGGNTMSANVAYGIQCAYQFEESPARIELAYDRLKNNGSLLQPTGITASDKLDINALTVTGLRRMPIGEALTGYVGGGVGYYLSSFKESFSGGYEWTRTGTSFGYHLDCGADYAVAQNIELFADLRYEMISYGAKTTVNITDVQGQIGKLKSEDMTSSWDHFMIRIGASYKF
jgi:opacity protein-like surface antigen